MFNVGGGEVIAIALVALIVLGPQRLPDAARQVGKVLGDLRKLSSGFQNEMKSAFVEADDPARVTARRNVLAKEVPPDEQDDAADDPAEVDPAEIDPAVSDAIAAVAAPRDPPPTAKASPPAAAQTTSVTQRASADEELDGESDVPETPPPRSTP